MKKMKKVLAGLLAATMVMSMSFTAFADSPSYPDADRVVIKKEYVAVNAGTESPEEIFNFTIEKKSVSDAAEGVTVSNMPLPTISSVSYGKGEATADDKNVTKDITISLNDENGNSIYTSVGIYTYTITETTGTTAGVEYFGEDTEADEDTDNDAVITLVVTVIEQGGKVRVAAVHTEEEPVAGTYGEKPKSDTFQNKYYAGSLSVSKKVTGLLGDTSKYFDVTVTFNAPSGETVRSDIYYTGGSDDYAIDATVRGGWTETQTVTLHLKNDDTFTFTNIPYGVSYTVEESNYTDEEYDVPTFKLDDASKKATARIESNNKGENVTVGYYVESTMNDEADSVEITNKKDGTVDTGIILDSAPYILLLALAAMGVFAVVNKKREEEF